MTVTEFILCEDIRYEQGNKISIMGVLNDSVEINTADPRGIQWPIAYRLGLFIRFTLEPAAVERKIDQFELSMTANKELVGKFQGVVRIQDAAAPVTLALVANPLPIKGPGEIGFQLVLKSGTAEVATIELPRKLKISAPRHIQALN